MIHSPSAGETQAERAVGPQIDRLALNRDLGVGFGGAVNNQLGVHFKPKWLDLSKPDRGPSIAEEGGGPDSETCSTAAGGPMAAKFPPALTSGLICSLAPPGATVSNRSTIVGWPGCWPAWTLRGSDKG